MIEKLKPCPFCGGEAMVQGLRTVDLFSGFRVRCMKCGASTNFSYGGIGHTRQRAVDAWNKRADEQEESATNTGDASIPDDLISRRDAVNIIQQHIQAISAWGNGDQATDQVAGLWVAAAELLALPGVKEND